MKTFSKSKLEPIHSGDAAALALAAVAGVVAIFLGKGQFDWLNGLAGLTIILIIIAFERSHKRDTLQSIAFGMTLAFVALLVIGTLWEKVVCLPIGDCSIDENATVHTDNNILAIIWVVVTVLTAWGDRVFQNRNKTTEVEELLEEG